MFVSHPNAHHFSDTALENRTCQLYKDNNFIEGEINFVCKSSAYSLVRVLVRENLFFFSKFNAYFKINEMDAHDQFCNIFKLDNVKLLVDYVNEL